MTLATEISYVEGTGNGVTTNWPFTFRIDSASQLKVYKITIADGAVQELVSGVSYTPPAEFGLDAGGTVVVSPAIASTHKIRIERDVDYTQTLDIQNQGNGFQPAVLESALDRLEQQIQQVKDKAILGAAGMSFDTIPAKSLIGSIAGGAPAHLTPTQVRDSVLEIYAKTTIDTYIASLTALIAAIPSAGERIITPYDVGFGAVGDGVADDTAAILAWAQAALDSDGLQYHCPAGDFLISSSISLTLNKSAHVTLASDAKFKAAVGFNGRLFQVHLGGSIAPGTVFFWHGGDYDGEEMANSGAGESDDVFQFYGDDNIDRCHIWLDRTYTGPNWLNAGSDSHLFIAGCKSIDCGIGFAQGAVDAGIYVSGTSEVTTGVDGTGHGLKVRGHFYRCSVGVIVKRLFENVDVRVTGQETVTVAAAGFADGTVDGVPNTLMPPGANMTFDVTGYRCDTLLNGQSTPGIVARLNAYESGIVIPAVYTTTGFFTASLSGATKSLIDINSHGINPDLVVGVNMEAMRITRRTEGGINYDSTDNIIRINSSGLHRAFADDANCRRNYISWRERSMVAGPSMNDATSVYDKVGTNAVAGDDGVLTIAAGIITATGGHHTVATEAAAASDDLTNVLGGVVGQKLILRAATSGQNVVVKNTFGGAGQIICGADRTLSSVNDVIELLRLATGAWLMIGYQDNA